MIEAVSSGNLNQNPHDRYENSIGHGYSENEVTSKVRRNEERRCLHFLVHSLDRSKTFGTQFADHK